MIAFKHDAQALTHGVDQVAARGVVIGVIAVPITMKFMQVEVITLHGFFTLLDDFDGPVVECDGGQPRQRAETFLASGITGVDLRVIDVYRHAAEAADGVYHEERAVRVRDALQFFQRLQESSRGLGDGGGEQFGSWMLFEGLFEH